MQIENRSFPRILGFKFQLMSADTKMIIRFIISMKKPLIWGAYCIFGPSPRTCLHLRMDINWISQTGSLLGVPVKCYSTVCGKLTAEHISCASLLSSTQLFSSWTRLVIAGELACSLLLLQSYSTWKACQFSHDLNLLRQFSCLNSWASKISELQKWDIQIPVF